MLTQAPRNLKNLGLILTRTDRIRIKITNPQESAKLVEDPDQREATLTASALILELTVKLRNYTRHFQWTHVDIPWYGPDGI